MLNSTIHQIPSPPLSKSGWPWTQESEPLPPTLPDGSPWPKISIVTPSFNQAQYLEETIRSVLLQGYPNLEYIIIDGGSTDGSVEIIKKYEPWLTYWVSEPDKGQSNAINKGVKRSTGDILYWLNSDDICLPDAFRFVAESFQSNPEVKIVIGQAYVIDQNGHLLGDLKSYFKSWEEAVTNPGNSVRQVSSFFSRNLFDKLGFIDESLNIAMDTDLLLRFTKYYFPLIVEKYLAAFRTHSGSKTYHGLLRGYQESDKLREKYFESKAQKLVYQKQSANHWLRLSMNERYSSTDKIVCIYYALRNNYKIIISREFWLSLAFIVIKTLFPQFSLKGGYLTFLNRHDCK